MERYVLQFVPNDDSIKSILDYKITFKALDQSDTHYQAIGMNYSTTGFQLVLTRKMSFYVVTYYLPSGLFVVVSWIRSASARVITPDTFLLFTQWMKEIADNKIASAMKYYLS